MSARARQARSRRHAAHALLSHARGAVMLEFLLAFVPVFALFLGVFQLALLAAARLVVRHAAVTAARAAVVVLPDDPRHYAGAPRLRVDSRAGAQAGPRMTAIRSAAHLPLAAIAPGEAIAARLLGAVRDTSANVAIGDGAATRLAFGLGEYVPLATAISFPRASGAAELHDSEVRGDPVVVRVTHLAPCAVPLAGAVLCDRLEWNAAESRLEARDASSRTRAALRELQAAPGAGRQQRLARSALPFAVLQAEASMPAQSADYAYADEERE